MSIIKVKRYIPVTGNFNPGLQNEAGQKLTEFCQENALVIANNLFQPHKRRLCTRTSPDANTEIRLIIFFAAEDAEALYSLYRGSIQLYAEALYSSIQKLYTAKTRLGADCGSDHEFFIAKFRLKLKKVGKITRQFRYDLNQVPYDYTVEVRKISGPRSDR